MDGVSDNKLLLKNVRPKSTFNLQAVNEKAELTKPHGSKSVMKLRKGKSRKMIIR